MWSRLRRWLNDVPIHDPIQRRQAPLLQIMLIGIIIGASLALVSNQIAPNTVERRRLGTAINALLILINISGLALLRRGRFRLAIVLPSITATLAVGIFFIALGWRNAAPFLIIFTVPTILVGLLAGRRALILIIGMCQACVISLLVLQHIAPALTGFVPVSDSTPLIVVVFILITSLAGLFLDRFGHTLNVALNDALARERELEDSRAALATRTAELEQENAERRRIEAALRESEERYRLIAEHTSDLVSLIDLDMAGGVSMPAHPTIQYSVLPPPS